MCKRCGNRYDCRDNCCNNQCYTHCSCNNRCDDFLLPMMFWLIRDTTRNCRCNWVNRYDRYRC